MRTSDIVRLKSLLNSWLDQIKEEELPKEPDPLTEWLNEAAVNWAGNPTTINEVAFMALGIERPDRSMQMRIGRVLRTCGFVRRRSSNGGRPWIYAKPDPNPIEHHIDESPFADEVSRVTPVRILTASDEQFIESWLASSSAADVATHLGMPSGHAASMRAAALRKAGVQLPMMRRGPRTPRAPGRAQGVMTIETFERAQARIDEINSEITST